MSYNRKINVNMVLISRKFLLWDNEYFKAVEIYLFVACSSGVSVTGLFSEARTHFSRWLRSLLAQW